jgi:D-methionine transport system ATP-binding protein
MIELSGIHLHYPGQGDALHALRGIDLAIGAGEVFGIIGKSGAGKSSLVRTINLLNRPTEGRVCVAGVDLTALDAAGLRAARREIGMVFQHFNLLAARTVYGNVALPLELQGQSHAAIRERVMALLDLVGLAGLADRYPAQISGGQKQRVGIARALACRPKVLLSDEATSSLDPETTRAILALLQRINRELGLTIVLITHQMQVIRQIAQRVAVMEAGRIVEQGAVLEVFTRPRHAITRSLIDEILPQHLPASVLAHVAARRPALPSGHDGRLLRLTYAGEQAEQPVLSRLIRAHDGVDANILHGQIDEIQGQAFGALAVYVSGPAQAVRAVAAGLANAGVQVRDVTADA